MNVALDVRIRNAEIAKAAQRFGSVRALADAAQVKYGNLVAWAALSANPWRRGGALAPEAVRVAEFLRVLPEDCFPVDLYLRFASQQTRALIVQDLPMLPLAEAMALPAPSEEDARDRAELRGVLATMLNGGDGRRLLTERAADVLRLHFGLDGDDPMTFEEIGRQLGITGGRVQQIEKTAIRRVRRSKRAVAALCPFLGKSASPEQERRAVAQRESNHEAVDRR